MEHELFSAESFERATHEARRLSEKFSVDVGIRRKGQGWVVVGPLNPEEPQQWRDKLAVAELLEAARSYAIEQQYAEADELLQESRDVILDNRYPNGELDEIDPTDERGRTYREVLGEIRFNDQCEPDPEWRDP